MIQALIVFNLTGRHSTDAKTTDSVARSTTQRPKKKVLCQTRQGRRRFFRLSQGDLDPWNRCELRIALTEWCAGIFRCFDKAVGRRVANPQTWRPVIVSPFPFLHSGSSSLLRREETPIEQSAASYCYAMSVTSAALNVGSAPADANGCNLDGSNPAVPILSPKMIREGGEVEPNKNSTPKAEGEPGMGDIKIKKEESASENADKENPSENVDNQENIGNGTHGKEERRENGHDLSSRQEMEAGGEKCGKKESENEGSKDRNRNEKMSGGESPRSIADKGARRRRSRSGSSSKGKRSGSDGGSDKGGKRNTSRSNGSRSPSRSLSRSRSRSCSRRNDSTSNGGRGKKRGSRSRSRSRRRYSLSSSRSRTRSRSPMRSRSIRRLRRSRSYSRSRSVSRSRYRRRSRVRSPSRHRRSRSKSRRSYSRSRSRRSSRSRSRRRGRSYSDDRRKGRDRRWRTKFRSRSRVRRSILNGNVEPDSQTRRLFTESLKELIRRRSLPCNISILNDIMRTRDRTFHVHKRGFPSFSLLCIAFEQEGLLAVQKTGQTWTISPPIWNVKSYLATNGLLAVGGDHELRDQPDLPDLAPTPDLQNEPGVPPPIQDRRLQNHRFRPPPAATKERRWMGSVGKWPEGDSFPKKRDGIVCKKRSIGAAASRKASLIIRLCPQ
ncbi:hypothetical protein BSKO_11887 [Bryopsis sp. KO-2023]|nr:hypothetical protein BSKO_11887 [Bryopsis sp. KO-2023]